MLFAEIDFNRMKYMYIYDLRRDFFKSLLFLSLSCFSMPGDSGMSSSAASSDSVCDEINCEMQISLQIS